MVHIKRFAPWVLLLVLSGWWVAPVESQGPFTQQAVTSSGTVLNRLGVAFNGSQAIGVYVMNTTAISGGSVSITSVTALQGNAPWSWTSVDRMSIIFSGTQNVTAYPTGVYNTTAAGPQSIVFSGAQSVTSVGPFSVVFSGAITQSQTTVFVTNFPTTTQAEGSSWSNGNVLTAIGGRVTTSATAGVSVGNGQVATVNFNTLGMLRVAAVPYNSSGTEYTPNDVTEDIAETGGEKGPLIMSVRRDLLASSSTTSLKYSTINSNSAGALWVSQPDPCSSESKTTTAVSQTADTVLTVATPNKRTYICSIAIVAGAAEIVSVSEGTGTVCGTSEVALTSDTTDANGMSFAANGGISAIGGNATVIAGKSVNLDICINQSSSSRVSGWVTWVKAIR